MSHLEILVPFGLPPPHLAQEWGARCQAPGLASLISRGKPSSPLPSFSPRARALPHEAWLAWRFGFSNDISETSSPPLASASLSQRGIEEKTGYWFFLHPVHFQLGYDHMSMANRHWLDITEAEARALFEAARPTLEAAGKKIIYGDARTWFLRADDWVDLVTATPDMASERHLTNWMPEGGHALAWRKLLNEVQMIWYRHPVNAERDAQKRPRINGLWLWGGAQAACPNHLLATSYTHGYGFTDSAQAYAAFFPAHQSPCELGDLLAQPPEHGLLLLDALLSPSLNADASAWQTAYAALEKAWFAPLEKALRQKRIDRLTLHLSNETTIKSYHTATRSLYRFWIRKNLNPLLP